MIQIQVNIHVNDGRTRLEMWQLSREDASEPERKLAAAFEDLFATTAGLLGPVIRNGNETFEMSEKEIDSQLREAGLDPDEVRQRGREFVRAELAAMKARINGEPA